MAASTGWILAAGGVAIANDALFTRPPDYGAAWRLVPVTAFLALAMSGLEKAVPEFALGISRLLFLGVLIFPLGKTGNSVLANINKALGYG